MTQTLQTLLELAERERDLAAARLAESEQALRAQRQQWEQLQVYRGDYLRRAPGQGGQAAPIQMLHHHQAFMLRLDQALNHQQRVLKTAGVEAEQRRQTLLHRDTRLAAVRKLLQRREQSAALAAGRAEQRQTDEAALQRHWHRRAVSS